MSDPVQTLTDMIDPARARAMQATIGHTPQIDRGDPLPPFFHQLYFWDPQDPAELGRDGHPKVGRVVPDMGLPRRMWAGGRLEFEAPLLAGTAAKRLTYVEKTAQKEGRSGPLGFVTMRHETWQGDTRCIAEWQDIVYREDPKPGSRPTPPEAPTDEDVAEPARFDTTMLFRYSALTFNGHRIHYDLPYATGVEGYDGLVVHGPLLAQLAMLLAERQLGTLTRFAFRATAPLMHFETAEICWKSDGTVWVRGPDGRQCLTGTAA
ncbi:MaoC family dehydratase N-terminal domain-containing protein [Roseovarius sp.]|uniref:FAS1-like dehydratase domain-containing protein n=1 Tax=Roseovarius sp. TaxID=1486281 RepID=UPI00262B0322|nr:MaoC family dehydratase N-terminal domain-containing protein [Roseovarius sp.]MDM8167319.1 acyl dehydratase [Roseovarius sp.]